MLYWPCSVWRCVASYDVDATKTKGDGDRPTDGRKSNVIESGGGEAQLLRPPL